MHRLILALLALAAPSDSVSPQDIWPQWRGPTGNSVAHGSVPLRWSKTDNVVWKAALPGWGNSTPILWQDAVFVSTQDGDRLLLLRLDRRTGMILWQRESR
jgi:hypothetical protein